MSPHTGCRALRTRCDRRQCEATNARSPIASCGFRVDDEQARRRAAPGRVIGNVGFQRAACDAHCVFAFSGEKCV